jgi:hypothetical protein
MFIRFKKMMLWLLNIAAGQAIRWLIEKYVSS